MSSRSGRLLPCPNIDLTRSYEAERSQKVLNRPPSAQQVKDENHDRYNEQQVDEGSAHMKTKTQQPQTAQIRRLSRLGFPSEARSGVPGLQLFSDFL